MPEEIDLSLPSGYARYEHLLTGSGIKQIRQTFTEYFFGTVPTSARRLQEILADFPADVMLSDAVMMAPQFVHEMGGPVWASYGDGPLALNEPHIPPFGPGMRYRAGLTGRMRNAVARRIAGRIFAQVDAEREAVRVQLGLKPDGKRAMELDISPYLHLQGCTPGFDYPFRNVPEHVRWVGALRPDPMPWSPPEWWNMIVRSPEPVIHVSQGSLRPDMTELIVPTVLAMADQPVMVVVTTGGPTATDLAAALGRPVPSNVIVAEFVPYDELLPHVDVFVTNGGYTGVTLALAHGVPIVQAGTTEEKAENGARIEHSGVGIALRTGRPSSGQVRDGINRVLEQDRYWIAAQRIAAEMAEHDAGREGAALLAELAATRESVTR
jgi:UDP:flavonoid glycosyltransferase YjiC (YdhE family)